MQTRDKVDDLPQRKSLIANTSDSSSISPKAGVSKDDKRARVIPVLPHLVRLFWYLPIALAVPVFLTVGELIPSYNNDSIGDGFRRLNVLLATMLPVFGVCWTIAVVLTACRDVPTLKGARRTLFFIGVSLICLFIVWVAIAILTGW